MPRVLVISAAFPPLIAGESTQALFLCRRLAAAGDEVHLLTQDRPDAPTNEPFAVRPVMRGWGWRQVPALKRALREVQPDCVLLIYSGWLYGYHPMITFLPQYLSDLTPRPRLVTMVTHPAGCHTRGRRWPVRVTHRLARLAVGAQGCYSFGTLLSRSDEVVGLAPSFLPTLTEHCDDVARRWRMIPPSPLVRLVPNPSGGARLRGRNHLGLTADQPLLTYTGLLAPGKGLETLMEAMARLLPCHPRLRLLLLGGVVNEHLPHHQQFVTGLWEQVERLGLRQAIQHVGPFDADDALPAQLLHASDVAVLPWDQGVHMNNSTIATVAAHGLPIVTTRPAELEGAFHDGLDLLLAAPRDAQGLALAVSRVLDDSALRQRLAAGSAALYAEHFSWERTLPALRRALHGEEPAAVLAPEDEARLRCSA